MSFRLPYLYFKTSSGLYVAQSFRYYLEAAGHTEEELQRQLQAALRDSELTETLFRNEVLLEEKDTATLRSISVSWQPTMTVGTSLELLSFEYRATIPVLQVQQGGDSIFHFFSEEFELSPLRLSGHKFPAAMLRRHLQRGIGLKSHGRLQKATRLPEAQLGLLELPKRKQAPEQNSVPTPQLERRARRLRFDRSGQQGKLSISQVWQRDQEIAQVQRLLLGRQQSILLRGEPQTGKSAVIRRALRNLHLKKKAPPVWIIEPSALVRNATYLGDWQKILEQLIEELAATGALLWVDPLPDLLSLSSDPLSGPAGYLLAQMQAGRIRIIGELTSAQEGSVQRIYPAFMSAFSKVEIQPLSAPAAQQVLERMGKELARRANLRIEHSAYQRIHQLMLRFYRFRHFPGKSIDQLLEVLAYARTAKLTVIDEQTVLAAFSESTGIPIALLDERRPLTPVREYLSGRIKGQPAVVEALHRTISLFRAGLNDPAKPIRVLFFAGPTGTGKTESAKVLSEYMFGHDAGRRLVRIDLSEYRSYASAASFIGSGHEAGKLLREVRRNPFAVVLLDEIEKAHPSVLYQLMSVFDEGTLTDPLGRITDFTNTIVIMTSNIGGNERRNMNFGGGQETIDQRYLSAISRYLPPEVYNRLDETVIFHPLEATDVESIVRLLLDQLNERRGLVHQQIRLRFSDALVAELAHRGYQEKSGARSIRTAIRRLVEQALGSYLLQHSREQQFLLVDWQHGKVTISEIEKKS